MLIHHNHRTLRIAIRTHVTYAKEAIVFLHRRKLRARVNYLDQESPKCSSNSTMGNPINISLHSMSDIPKVFNGLVEKISSNECEVRYLQCKTIFVQRY